MAFNVQKYQSAKSKHRQTSIKVPDLAAFFDDDDEAVWVVRGLTFNEMSVCTSRAESSERFAEIANALLNKGLEDKEASENLKEALDVNENQPTTHTKMRLQYLQMASISPLINSDISLKLSEVHPIIFKQLTDEIITLMGRGQDVEKPKASGKT